MTFRRDDKAGAGAGPAQRPHLVLLRRRAGPTPRGALRPLLLANFSDTATRTIRDLLAVHPVPAPQVWSVPRTAPRELAELAAPALVVREIEAVGIETVDTLVKAYGPVVLLVIVRSLKTLAELRRSSRVPFVAREHPLGPADLVAVACQLCQP